MFFEATDVVFPRQTVPLEALAEVKSPNLKLPYVLMEQGTTRTLIRVIAFKDVPYIVDLMMFEYGRSASSFTEWMQQIGLRNLIDLTMRLKCPRSISKFPEDHAVIIAAVETDDSPVEHIVGIVEVSRQPPLPERNPPPIPFPLSLKYLMCGTNLVGWVTNLLVSRKYRGLGYAKLLLATSEGVALQWNVRSMHLHCDADGSGDGKIPQKLYDSMGYKPSCKSGDPDGIGAWGPRSSFQSSVYFIDDVPLLYLTKNLV